MTVQEWLGEDNQLGIDIWERKYRYNSESFEQWLERVSAGDNRVRNMIINKEFLFGDVFFQTVDLISLVRR